MARSNAGERDFFITSSEGMAYSALKKLQTSPRMELNKV